MESREPVLGWRADQDKDDSYQLTVHRSESVEGMFSATDDLAVFAVPIPGGPDLQAAGQIGESRRLRVILHGAVSIEHDRYPRFDRIEASLQSEDAFLSFADPTLLLSREMTLAWYTGSKDWDPHARMVEVIREALSASGARELVFIGASGGGFAALRLSAEFPDSGAFVFSPQTSLARYQGSHFALLLAEGYGGLTPEEAYEVFPARFDVISTYGDGFKNNVYYLQNLGDPGHVGSHYNPIRRAVGIRTAEGVDSTGRFTTVLADLEREGHGPPTRAEFDRHLTEALTFFRDGRRNELSRASDAVLSLRAEVAELRETVDAIGDYSKRSHRAIMRELGILPWSSEVLSRVAAELIPQGRELPPVGSYALRAASVAELTRVIRETMPLQVFECGSGSSTVWIALCLEAIGEGHLTSLESSAQYARSTRRLLEDHGVEHRATIVEAPLATSNRTEGSIWYDIPATAELPESIDVLLVDGPPSSGGPRIREPALAVLNPLIAADALILVDDADRSDEKEMIEHWIDAFGLVRDERTTELVTLRRDVPQ